MKTRRLTVTAVTLRPGDTVAEVLDTGSSVRFLVDRQVDDSDKGKIHDIRDVLRQNQRPQATINDIKVILGMDS